MDHLNYATKNLPVQENENSSEEEENLVEEQFDYKLIKQVQMYPYLYNNKRKKSDQVSETWKTISTAVGETDDECKTRWTRLRQYYSKERNRRESGDIRQYKWPLYDRMTFLDPFIIRKSIKKKVRSSVGSVKTSVPLESTSNSLESQNDLEIDTAIEQRLVDEEIPYTDEPSLTFNNNEENNFSPLDSELCSDIQSLDGLTECNNVKETPLKHLPEPPTIATLKQVSDQDIIGKEYESCKTIQPLSDISNLQVQQEKIKIPVKDEENSVIANLVEKRLQKMDNTAKKNKLILQIMNILFE